LLNTNIFPRPFSGNNFIYSKFRFYSHGFEEFDNFFKNEILKEPLKKLPREKIFSNLEFFCTKDKELILFDERINWFSRVWYFQRYQMYYGVSFISFSDIADTVSRYEEDVPLLDILSRTNAREYWVVMSADKERSGVQGQEYGMFMNSFEEFLSESGIEPVKTVYDYKQDESMRIYKLNLVSKDN